MEKNIDGNKLIREICSLVVVFLCIFLLLSLYSYSPKDPSFNVAVSSSSIKNWGGLVGAYISGLIVELFGCISWCFPFILMSLGLSGIFGFIRVKWFRILGFLFIFLFILMFLGSFWGSNISIGSIHGGGYIGRWLFSIAYKYLNFGGIILLWIFLVVLGVQLMFLFLWKDFFQRSIDVVSSIKAKTSKIIGKKTLKNVPEFLPNNKSNKPKINNTKKQNIPSSSLSEKGNDKQRKDSPAQESPTPDFDNKKYPPVDLLDPIQEEKEEIESGYFEDLSNRLIACLKDFGIEGELLNIKPGPVVTMFEFRPAPGIKISRIAQLNSDLALAMKAIAVRIEAPIPGKDYIGIEIPNKKRKVVYFREIVESEVFKKHKGGLPIILGKDIQGNPRVEDLSKMPHLLVAGATGAGKSVCLNSIIISLLIRFSPEEVKFLLIDPKRIEMASYAGLPHLIHPVVTEMELAKTSLEWAVFEMEQRYDLMAKVGVRNISAYNEKVKKGELEEMQVSPMPYLVLIIDEMADLMLTVGKEAEAYIIRLAQLARAAGIHLILATQRPSVDVVTGLIKANFPARIGFQVTSKHDSRTILDTVGAENLLGKGDMLFKPAAGRIQRLHGAYISDGEINRVIEFWRKKFPEQQHLDFKEWKMEKEEDNSSAVGDGVCDDPMYKDAVKFVMEQGKVSISMLQRYLRIGFNRAARFVEQMEKDGIIGPQEGSKPRIVLKK